MEESESHENNDDRDENGLEEQDQGKIGSDEDVLAGYQSVLASRRRRTDGRVADTGTK